MMSLIKSIVVATCGVGLLSCSSGSGFNVKGSSSATASLSSTVYGSLECPACSGTPTEFNVRVFKAYLSENADCSDPILVQDRGSSGEVFNFFSNPTIFSGTPPSGTYNCLILVIHDTMTFKVDQEAVDNHNGCTSTTATYTFDVYRAGESDSGQWVDINGDSIPATGSAASPGSDQVTIFMTTGNEADIRADGVAPNTNQVGRLTGTSLTVPGSVTYYWDASDGIKDHTEGSVDYCWIESVSTGFR